jgi:hypothetical protein
MICVATRFANGLIAQRTLPARETIAFKWNITGSIHTAWKYGFFTKTIPQKRTC